MDPWPDGTPRTTPTACFSCGNLLDAAQSVKGGEVPSAGTISVCFYCSSIAIFDEDLSLRGFTEEELQNLMADAAAMATIARAVGACRFIRAARN